ncbi:chitin disaccharide deacetylase [Vibrio hangzhouensis]|uniref:Chitin disaccharide deacetylase n=2 Tax=Vibrio hangzhouensis TaxID=462991 RepID=A0A1H6BSH5_9VIBR|nr:carbohydrate-binding protein [Vibrio hangzhouensis]SEG63395.1 chitin disaccharide deacetylase [Vibrio hangzhouensis]
MKKITSIVSSLLIPLSFGVSANEPKGTIYLTFDDGPINASIKVIETLNKHNVKGSFFFNAWHLDGIGDENEDHALEALLLALNTGHMIGNHSYDHMVHNCDGANGENTAEACNATGMHNVNSYRNPSYDYTFFPLNLAKLEQHVPNITSYPNYVADQFARLPYTNGWRVTKDLKADGLCATSDDYLPWDPNYVCDPENPSNSANNAMVLSDMLTNDSYQLFGWDLDWAPENWGIAMPANSLTEPEAFLTYVKAAQNSCAPVTIEPVNSKAQNFPCDTPLHKDKVIVLTHEFLFEDGRRGMGETQNIPKLDKFLALALEAGYVFDTLDNYIPQWQPDTQYTTGDHVDHQGTVYVAQKDHFSQSDWAPSLYSTLWSNADPATNWQLNVDYQLGDIVVYNGVIYEVITAHVSQVDWTPDKEPTLFSTVN